MGSHHTHAGGERDRAATDRLFRKALSTERYVYMYSAGVPPPAHVWDEDEEPPPSQNAAVADSRSRQPLRRHLRGFISGLLQRRRPAPANGTPRAAARSYQFDEQDEELHPYGFYLNLPLRLPKRANDAFLAMPITSYQSHFLEINYAGQATLVPNSYADLAAHVTGSMHGASVHLFMGEDHVGVCHMGRHALSSMAWCPDDEHLCMYVQSVNSSRVQGAKLEMNAHGGWAIDVFDASARDGKLSGKAWAMVNAKLDVLNAGFRAAVAGDRVILSKDLQSKGSNSSWVAFAAGSQGKLVSVDGAVTYEQGKSGSEQAKGLKAFVVFDGPNPFGLEGKDRDPRYAGDCCPVGEREGKNIYSLVVKGNGKKLELMDSSVAWKVQTIGPKHIVVDVHQELKAQVVQRLSFLAVCFKMTTVQRRVFVASVLRARCATDGTRRLVLSPTESLSAAYWGVPDITGGIEGDGVGAVWATAGRALKSAAS